MQSWLEICILRVIYQLFGVKKVGLCQVGIREVLGLVKLNILMNDEEEGIRVFVAFIDKNKLRQAACKHTDG